MVVKNAGTPRNGEAAPAPEWLTAEPVVARYEHEHQLAQRIATGLPVDAATGDPRLDSVAHAPEWGEDRIVRAEFLAYLLLNHPTPRAVVLRGARITGPLVFRGTSLRCPVLLRE